MKRLYFYVLISVSILSNMAYAQPGKLDYINRTNLKGSAYNVPLAISNGYTYVMLDDVYIPRLAISSQGNITTYDLSTTPLYAQYKTAIDTGSIFSLYPDFIYWMVTNAMGAYNIKNSAHLKVVSTDTIMITLCYVVNLSMSKNVLTPGEPPPPDLTALISYGQPTTIGSNAYLIYVQCSDDTQTCDLLSQDASKNLYIYFPENVGPSPSYPSGYAYDYSVSTNVCTSRIN